MATEHPFVAALSHLASPALYFVGNLTRRWYVEVAALNALRVGFLFIAL